MMPTELGDFHHPHPLSDYKGFSEKYEKALKHCEDGLPPKESVELAFGIHIDKYKWRNWKKWAIEDMDAGFTEEDSNLIKLMMGLAAKDQMLHKRLSRKAISIAESGHSNMLQFLLKTRYDYSEKTRSEVELDVEEAPILFNIVDMTPNEEEEE